MQHARLRVRDIRICVYTCISIFFLIYIYIHSLMNERKRERERKRDRAATSLAELCLAAIRCVSPMTPVSQLEFQNISKITESGLRGSMERLVLETLSTPDCGKSHGKRPHIFIHSFSISFSFCSSLLTRRKIAHRVPQKSVTFRGVLRRLILIFFFRYFRHRAILPLFFLIFFFF